MCACNLSVQTTIEINQRCLRTSAAFLNKQKIREAAAEAETNSYRTARAKFDDEFALN